MKKLILTLALVAVGAFAGFTYANKAEASAETTPNLLAVKFHADWCGSCKALKPLMAEARSAHKLDAENVSFVILDVTDDTTKNQAKLMADNLGIAATFAAQKKTGFYLLINSATKQVLGKITKNESPAQIAQLIKESIAAL